MVASSRAISRPRRVINRAVNLRRGGMVIIGVFKGVMLEVMRRPARMLPPARRLIGLVVVGLFSLMGCNVLNRGWPMGTKKIMRRL